MHNNSTPPYLVDTTTKDNHKPPRSSNLELYRIIVMLGIVAHHYIVHSEILDNVALDGFTPRAVFAAVFGMWGKTGINCFVLITGYFMCKSQITVQKFLKLVLEVMFYNIVIYSAFAIFGDSKIDYSEMIKHFLPVNKITGNFTGCFIVFYLFIPFLNILIKNLTQEQHKYLVILSLSTYTLIGSFIGEVIMNYVSWFVTLYFVASYIRFYAPIEQITTKQWCMFTLGSIACAILSVIVLEYIILAKYPEKISSMYKMVSDCNKIFALLVALCSFMLFKNIKLEYSKVINTIAASTFGVLLIHDNCRFIREFLWKNLFQNAEAYFSPFFVLHAVLVVCGVFTACIAIDYARIKIVEGRLMKWVELKFEDKLGYFILRLLKN